MGSCLRMRIDNDDARVIGGVAQVEKDFFGLYGKQSSVVFVVRIAPYSWTKPYSSIQPALLKTTELYEGHIVGDMFIPTKLKRYIGRTNMRICLLLCRMAMLAYQKKLRTLTLRVLGSFLGDGDFCLGRLVQPPRWRVGQL